MSRRNCPEARSWRLCLQLIFSSLAADCLLPSFLFVLSFFLVVWFLFSLFYCFDFDCVCFFVSQSSSSSLPHPLPSNFAALCIAPLVCRIVLVVVDSACLAHFDFFLSFNLSFVCFLFWLLCRFPLVLSSLFSCFICLLCILASCCSISFWSMMCFWFFSIGFLLSAVVSLFLRRLLALHLGFLFLLSAIFPDCCCISFSLRFVVCLSSSVFSSSFCFPSCFPSFAFSSLSVFFHMILLLCLNFLFWFSLVALSCPRLLDTPSSVLLLTHPSRFVVFSFFFGFAFRLYFFLDFLHTYCFPSFASDPLLASLLRSDCYDSLDEHYLDEVEQARWRER